MDALVQAIEGTAINNWVLSSSWLWPLLEILHFIGLSLLLGSLIAPLPWEGTVTGDPGDPTSAAILIDIVYDDGFVAASFVGTAALQ